MMDKMIVFILVSYLTFLYSLVVLVQRQWIVHLKKQNNMYYKMLEERMVAEQHEETKSQGSEDEQEEETKSEEAEDEQEESKSQGDMTETPPSLPERDVKETFRFQDLPSEMKGVIASHLENQDREALIAALANPPPLLNSNEEDEDYSDMPPLIPATSMTEPSQDL